MTTSPIDRAKHLAFLGPLGAALAGALPDWVQRGVSSWAEQYQTAKAVGELVTDYGQQLVTQKLVGLGILPGPPPPPRSAPLTVEADLTAAADSPDLADPPSAERREDRRPSTASPSPAGPTPDPDDLAIPGYDSLSASQVVSRLAGLAPAELEAVRGYEGASRGRRTILTKIAQLQSERA